MNHSSRGESREDPESARHLAAARPRNVLSISEAQRIRDLEIRVAELEATLGGERRKDERRFELLADTAGELLRTPGLQRMVEAVCAKAMAYLDCHAFFNFLVDERAGKLHLNACAGIPEEEARRIEWLDYGVAVCGCAARDGCRIVAEHIPTTPDPRTELVKSYGIKAYACHPLYGPGSKVLGTLSFGTRTRETFSDDDLSLMKAVADQVAVAMIRLAGEQALRESEAELREVDQRKNEFLAVLSHELRNPLTPIRNGLFILDHVEPGTERARRALEVLGRQVGHLSHLVDDLLDATRITRNKITLQEEALELNELVRAVVEDHRSLFEKNRVRLEVSLADRPLRLMADRTRLAQVVGNLLENAAKFTDPEGEVRVFVSAEPATRRAVIRVADTGIGITEDLLSRLFVPFTQADRSLDRTKGGLGLGLALVKRLVELHGGEVTAHSDGAGRGAQLTVRLPLAEELSPAPEAAKGPAPRRSRRVLIVDDNLDGADSLREALELSGHQVAVARDGPEGLVRARERLPEIVLCDIGLPGMDGYEVARAFRSDPGLASIALIALSGYALPEDLERAREAGFERHIAKPPRMAELDAAIAAAGA